MDLYSIVTEALKRTGGKFWSGLDIGLYEGQASTWLQDSKPCLKCDLVIAIIPDHVIVGKLDLWRKGFMIGQETRIDPERLWELEHKITTRMAIIHCYILGTWVRYYWVSIWWQWEENDFVKAKGHDEKHLLIFKLGDTKLKSMIMCEREIMVTIKWPL